MTMAPLLLAALLEYTLDPEGSRVDVHVGKAGLFKFAGHEHEVRGAPLRGVVRADPREISASSVSVELSSAGLRVVPDNEPKDAPKVERTMHEEVLEVTRHPMISFRSASVRGQETAPGRYAVEVTGTLVLHGVSRTLTVPMEVEIAGQKLTARGKMSVTHTAFELRRVSAGGGTVKVANDVEIELALAFSCDSCR
jgi:polyisoprenoid-binding protein YceI